MLDCCAVVLVAAVGGRVWTEWCCVMVWGCGGRCGRTVVWEVVVASRKEGKRALRHDSLVCG